MNLTSLLVLLVLIFIFFISINISNIINLDILIDFCKNEWDNFKTFILKIYNLISINKYFNLKSYVKDGSDDLKLWQL